MLQKLLLQSLYDIIKHTMDNVISFFKNNKFNLCIIFLYFVIAITAMFHHELWRDEAQVWCIVRDMNLADIFNTSRIEGHPVLWYLLVMPFAKLGFNVVSMQILSLLSVFCAVVYFVFKCPCGKLLKTFVVFSSGLLYYLSIIARNYSLVPIFIFLLAGFYHKRKEHPILYSVLIALLANTHSLMLGLCLILAFIFCLELIKEKLDRNKVIAVSILVINFLFLFFSFYNMQNVNHATAYYAQNPKDLTTAFIYFAQIFFLFPLSMLPSWLSVGLFYALMLLSLGFYFKQDKKLFLILLCSFGFQWFIYYKVWYIGIVYQKSFLLMLAVLFCYWVYTQNKENSKFLTVITTIFFAISFISSGFNIMFEINYPYSGSKELAQYIRKNLNDEKEFIVWGYPFCFSVISAYLPDKKLYMIDREQYITYYPFNLESKSEKFPRPDSKYYITVENFVVGENYEKIFQTNPNIINLTEYNEIFSISKKKSE